MTQEYSEPELLSAKVVKDLDLSGYLVPWKTEEKCPVLLKPTPDYKDVFMVIFSTKEKLEAFFKEFDHVSCDSSKVILDHHEFMDCIARGIRVMVDPYKHLDKVRYTEVTINAN